MRRAAAKKQLRKDGLRRAVAESRRRRALEKRHWERAVSEEKDGKERVAEEKAWRRLKRATQGIFEGHRIYINDTMY